MYINPIDLHIHFPLYKKLEYPKEDPSRFVNNIAWTGIFTLSPLSDHNSVMWHSTAVRPSMEAKWVDLETRKSIPEENNTESLPNRDVFAGQR